MWRKTAAKSDSKNKGCAFFQAMTSLLRDTQRHTTRRMRRILQDPDTARSARHNGLSDVCYVCLPDCIRKHKRLYQVGHAGESVLNEDHLVQLHAALQQLRCWSWRDPAGHNIEQTAHICKHLSAIADGI